jgi:hypothetical protein
LVGFTNERTFAFKKTSQPSDLQIGRSHPHSVTQELSI